MKRVEYCPESLSPLSTHPPNPSQSSGITLVISFWETFQEEKPSFGFLELHCLCQVNIDFLFPLPYSWLEEAFQGHRRVGLSGPFTGVIFDSSKFVLVGGGREEGELL